MPRKKKVEEPKEEEPISFEPEKPSLKDRLRKAGKIFLGILIVLGGLFAIWLFWPEFLQALEGLIGVILILIGLLVIALGWFD